MTHSEKVYLARQVACLNLRCFAVISWKITLGEYTTKIRSDPQKYYNKCAAYLLEKIFSYLRTKGLASGEVEVIFERRNHDYERLKRYIKKIRDNPLHPAAENLQLLNTTNIADRAKKDEPLLRYADFVAHAVYQCVNKSSANWGIPEPRYVEELAMRFGADSAGRVLGYGLKCIHSLDALNLDPDVRTKLEKLKAIPLTPLPQSEVPALKRA